MTLLYEDDVPFDLDPGEVWSPSIPTYAQGCTGGGFPPCQCITLGNKGDGGGLHVARITAGAKESPSSDKRGWYRALRNGGLFLKSARVTLPDDGFRHGWTWCKKNGAGVCQGWTFNEGDVIACGFWDEDRGGWLHGILPAEETVHAA